MFYNVGGVQGANPLKKTIPFPGAKTHKGEGTKGWGTKLQGTSRKPLAKYRAKRGLTGGAGLKEGLGLEASRNIKGGRGGIKRRLPAWSKASGQMRDAP